MDPPSNSFRGAGARTQLRAAGALTRRSLFPTLYLMERDEYGRALAQLAENLYGRRSFLLTGAGMSTDSGIPDYRGPESRKRRGGPIQHRDFVRSSEARRSYWARSFIGWHRVRDAKANEGHEAIAELERSGVVSGLVTQNVDGLHHAAGSSRVVELHGSLSRVRCLSCGREEERESVQRRLARLNPEWTGDSEAFAPDGDVELPPEMERNFCVPTCRHCGGVLKPDVVFFGDTVPKERVERAWDFFRDSDLVLVAGSSLTVFSGYRFVRAAAKEGKPVYIINRGETRGDAEAAVKLEGGVGELLPRLVEALHTGASYGSKIG